MKNLFILVVVGLCGTFTTSMFAIGADKPSKLDAELKELQGEWRVVLVEERGEKKETKPRAAVQVILTIKEQSYKVVWDAGPGSISPERQGKFKIDPTTNPKSIDFTPALDALGSAGIYTTSAVELYLCFPLGKGKNRPTSF